MVPCYRGRDAADHEEHENQLEQGERLPHAGYRSASAVDSDVTGK